MRILQVIPVYDSYHVFLRDLVGRLVTQGHEVLTVCDCQQRLLPFAMDHEFPLRHMDFPRGANPWQQLRAARRLRAVIREFRPDVVHAHFSSAILVAALARFRHKKSASGAGLRWFGTFQGLQFPLATGWKRRLFKCAEALGTKGMDSTWVLTDDDSAALRAAAPMARVVRQTAFGFGCHDRFHDAPPTSAEAIRALRESWQVPQSATVYLFLGRLVAFKGFHLAARAFLRAHEQRPDAHFVVVGERDPIHPSGLSDTEWRALQAHPCVHFIGLQEDVLPVIDAAEALLFPTAREGMPVGVMETLARRRPVLTNRVRGCAELVQPGINGQFFESASEAAIAEVLREFRLTACPPPNPLTRRSAWIEETVRAYSRPQE